MARHAFSRLGQSLLVLLVLISTYVAAQNVLEKVIGTNVTRLSTQEIEEQLEVYYPNCTTMRHIANHKQVLSYSEAIGC